jgi:acyl carrier protein
MLLRNRAVGAHRTDDRMWLLALTQDVSRQVLKRPDYQLDEATPLGDNSDWSSLNHLEVMMELEDRLGVTLELDDFSEVETVGRLINLLIAAGAGPGDG